MVSIPPIYLWWNWGWFMALSYQHFSGDTHRIHNQLDDKAVGNRPDPTKSTAMGDHFHPCCLGMPKNLRGKLSNKHVDLRKPNGKYTPSSCGFGPGTLGLHRGWPRNPEQFWFWATNTWISPTKTTHFMLDLGETSEDVLKYASGLAKKRGIVASTLIQPLATTLEILEI